MSGDEGGGAGGGGRGRDRRVRTSAFDGEDSGAGAEGAGGAGEEPGEAPAGRTYDDGRDAGAPHDPAGEQRDGGYVDGEYAYVYDGRYDDRPYDEGPYDGGQGVVAGGAGSPDGTTYDDVVYDPTPSGGVPPDFGRRQSTTGYSRPRRRRRRGHHRILGIFALLVVIVVAVAAIGVVYARRSIHPTGALGPVVTLRIPKGSSTSDIGKVLAHAGVIREARLFPVYAKLTNAGDLLPGTYHLAKNESYDQAIRALQQGPPLIVEKLTIPEGYTMAQIAARVGALPHLHLSAAKFLQAASSGQVRSQFEPPGVNNLEGLVFPATYEIRQGQEEADVLQEMVNTFDERVSSLGLVAAAAKLHYTPYQVVTVASIVEREAKLEADRTYVASVVYNRLAKKMPIGADSTETYYLRLSDPDLVPTAAQLNEDSPYNTRLHEGLPPTPIANPGIPSLQAAMDPVASPYLYFVEVNPDGKLGFASDSAGFAKLEDECRSAHLC